MAGLIKQLVDGVVDAAVKEVLRKVGIGRTAAGTARTRKKASGGLLSDILDAALAPEKKTAAKPARGSAAKKPAKRTAAAAAKKKTRRG
ncbi:hypothetical protein [Shinella pollutisoli]|uniref:Uncharacterized protein n=1 Tax=Shinella pollutisoli TaxID=2250594 RepID=A0ABV7DEG7_9HYPH|nr:hypothetical protein [Shinella pollutisoli]